jgi:hypothetical protein
MVGKINPSDDNKRIPPKSQELSFHQDYTSPQQKVMNEHINELKNLLKHADAKNPEIQQRIAELRHQIQYEDLPAVGLSERRKPTISDALEYIDQQSGYTAYQAALEAASKKSKKSGWRQLTGAAPTSVSMSKTQTKLKIGKGSGADDLNTIAINLANWQKQNPSELNSQISAIQGAISALAKTKTQNNGASLRSFIQLNPALKTLFNPTIYDQLSDKNSLKTLFSALNFDASLLPSSPPSASSRPPFIQGYTAFVLKNLPKDVTQISVPSNRTPPGDPVPKFVYAYVPGKGQLPVKSPMYTSPDKPPVNQQFINISDLRTFTDPATGQTSPVLYIPTGMPSTQIVFGPSFSTFCECTIGDPDAQGHYRSDLNFTGVNGIPPEAINIQMGGTDGYSSRNGISTDRASFVTSIQSLYDKYDPSGVWKSTMFEADGTVKSGKFMTDPRIVSSMSNYLSNKFLPQLASTTFYFMDDGNVPDSGHAVKNSDGSWSFISANFPNQPQKLPDTNDMNAWISGGAWPSPEQEGFIKAITSFVNLGIPPTLTSSTNRAGNDYFTKIDNVQNFYQADFYNIYRRAVHESGCNAYAADYDDEMGGDGEVNDSSANQTFFTISLGASSPTPPAFDPNSVADQLFENNPTTIAKEWKGENVVGQINSLIASINQAITNYKNNPTQAAYNALQAQFATLANLQKQATTLASDMLTYKYGSDLNDVVKAVTGQDATPDQLAAVANAMATHEVDPVQPMPGPPGPPPSFDPNKAIDFLAQHFQGRNIVGDYKNYAQYSETEAAEYQKDLTTYQGLTGQAKTDYYNNTLLPTYNALKDACGGMKGMAESMMIVNQDDINAALQKGFLKPGESLTDDERDAMAKALESRYVPSVPDMPQPPIPGFDPQKATNEIYGNAQLQFHNQFMNLPVVQEIAKYQADVTAYRQNPTAALYAILQRESSQIAIDLPGLKGAITALLNNPANQKIMKTYQDLANLTPDKIAALASYITTTKESAALTVPPLPGPPPLNPAQQYLKTLDDWLTAHNDKGSGDGIYQELEQPLSTAMQKSGFTTLADIQNWLKNSAAGQQAMKYLTSPTIYAKDPALAALPAGSAQSAALQDLFNKLQITAPVPSPPGPPGPTDLGKFKDAINAWLASANGEKQYQHAGDPQGYLRSTFANKIFSLIDGGGVKTMDQLKALIASGIQGQGPLASFAALLSANIYKADPAFQQMAPADAQKELQQFFNVLGITAPVPTPPGPPPSDDVARLKAAFPGQLTSQSGMWTQQMIQLMQDLKVHASPGDLANLMKAFYKQYMNLLPGLLKGRTDFPLPASQYATELCQAEWKASGAAGPCPPLT